MYFDFEKNLNFWADPIDCKPVKFVNDGDDIFSSKAFSPEDVMRPFLNFRSKAININDVFDFGMKKITP